MLSVANLKRTLGSPRNNKSAFGTKGEGIRSHRPPTSSLAGRKLSKRGEDNENDDQEADSYLDDHFGN